MRGRGGEKQGQLSGTSITVSQCVDEFAHACSVGGSMNVLLLQFGHLKTFYCGAIERG